MPSVSGNVGAVFNGGTISTPLTVNAGDSTDLTLRAVANANATILKINVNDTEPTAYAYVTDTEATLIVGSTAAGPPSATLYADPTGAQLIVARPSNDAAVFLSGFALTNFLQVLVNFSSQLVFRIDPDGYLMISLNAAPADAAVTAGEMALWFDDTNGAAKLMVKAKQADGTVRTGSLALV